LLIFLFLIALPDARLNTSFYTFQKFGGYGISDLYLNYAFSRYTVDLVLERRASESGLRSFSIGIDSLIKDYYLTVGERQIFLNGPLSTTLPLWGITVTGRDIGLFLGKAKDYTTALPPTFHQNNYTFGFKFQRNFSYRAPVEFYFLKKNDASGIVTNNNSFGMNTKLKVSENLFFNSQVGFVLSEFNLGSAFSLGANYNGQRYGTNIIFRKVFENFVTPSNLLTEPGNWFQANTYFRPLNWLSIGQDISYSNIYNLNLGLNLGLNRYPLPELGYGISYNRKTEIFGQNLHLGWYYKKFSIATDYARSAIEKSFGLKITRDIKNFQFWSQFQLKTGKIYQLGASLPFTKNIRTKWSLNFLSQNGATKTSKTIDLSLKILRNFNLNSTYEMITYNHTSEHLFSLGVSSSLLFEKTGLSFITGKVFMDLNNNGIFDYEDRAVSDIEVILDGKDVIKTDKNGNYQFSFVPSGEHTLNLNLINVPAEIGAGKGQRSVNTRFLSRARVHFPLGELGSIEGLVYYDDNKNGKMESDERGIPNVVIGLNGYLTTTDTRGRFRFANLMSGTYSLEVKVLPPETFLSVPEISYIHLKPGERFQDYQIGVIRKERPVQKKRFEEPQIIKPLPPPSKKPIKRVTPEEIENLFKKGVNYFLAEQYKEALKIFNQVLTINPEHRGALEYKKRTQARLEALKRR